MIFLIISIIDLKFMPESDDVIGGVCMFRLEECEGRGEARRHALVVDGRSLAYALDAYHEQLRRVCERCVTVLCCRMTPIQKALVRVSPPTHSSQLITSTKLCGR